MIRILALGILSAALALPAQAQFPPGRQRSSNIQALSHIPLGRIFTIGNIDIEQ